MSKLIPVDLHKGVNIYDKFEVMEFYHSGDPEKEAQARDAVVEMMDRYVHSEIERKYGSFKDDKEDLYQSCMVKILEDLDSYNPELGNFTTYFQRSITNACSNYLSQKHHHSSPYYADKARKVKRAIDDLEKQGIKWTATDIAVKTGMSRKNVDDALILIERCEKEGELAFDSETKNASAEKGIVSPEIYYIDQIRKNLLEEALSTLDPLERELIEVRSKEKKQAYKELEEKYEMKQRTLIKMEKRAQAKLSNYRPLREFIRGESNYNPRNKTDMTFCNLFEEDADNF